MDCYVHVKFGKECRTWLQVKKKKIETFEMLQRTEISQLFRQWGSPKKSYYIVNMKRELCGAL